MNFCAQFPLVDHTIVQTFPLIAVLQIVKLKCWIWSSVPSPIAGFLHMPVWRTDILGLMQWSSTDTCLNRTAFHGDHLTCPSHPACPTPVITSTLPIAHHRWYSVFSLSASVSIHYFPWHEQAWRVSQDALCKLYASNYCLKWSEGNPGCWGMGCVQRISKQKHSSISRVMLMIGDIVLSYGLQLLIYSV